MPAKKQPARKPTRRRAAGRPRSGDDDVVRSVLTATIKELNARGFVDLRIEAIAKEARVAKSSIYRRWPTKSKLVLAAWLAFRQTTTAERRSGKGVRGVRGVRGQLVRVVTSRAERMRTRAATAIGVALAALDDAETRVLADDLYQASAQGIVSLLGDAAVGRNDDRAAAAELLLAFVTYRCLMRKAELRPRDIERAVDVILYGVLAKRTRARR